MATGITAYLPQRLLPSLFIYSSSADFFFYRDRQGKEVDLIIQEGQTITPIEIKRTASPEKSMAANFTAVKVNPPELLGAGAILCSVETPRLLEENLFAVPISLI